MERNDYIYLIVFKLINVNRISNIMTRKIVFGLMWLALVIYSVTFTVERVNSSGDAFQQDLDLIINMSIIEWDGINPIVIAIFFIMGIFPLVYGALILFDSKEQPVSPYPFFVTSFGLGAFTLLPYLALRQRDTSCDREKNLLLKILDSRLTAIVCSFSIFAFVIWGAVNGDWSDFVNQWHNSQFVHIMTIDFAILSVILPAAMLQDDMKRRGVEQQGIFWLIALIPIIGSSIYWCVRPQLNEVTSNLSAEAET